LPFERRWHGLRHRKSRISHSPRLSRHPAREERVSAMFEQQLGRSVTIDQAAALLHVSRRTIYNRIRDGKLQTIRTLGGSQRVLLSSLDENRKPVWSEETVAPTRAPENGSHES
jgi:excisionase family DNA binding protein